MHRRWLVGFSALASCVALDGRCAGTSAPYPNRPVRLIVPASPGGFADILARLVSPRFADNTGEQLVVDNRGGANSILGTELAAKTAPDGYTLLIVAIQHAVNPTLYEHLPYDTQRDFAPITLAGSTPLLIVTHPSVPVASLDELIALAKKRPGDLSYASGGNGSPANLGGALLTTMANIKILHVPYKGVARATNDVLAGQVNIGFPSIAFALPFVKDRRLKALAITSLKRSPLTPDVPTAAEAGVRGYETLLWSAILAPAKTPPEIVARLGAEFGRTLREAPIRERVAGMGGELTPGTPEELRRFIAGEIAKWGKVVRETGMRGDLP